MSDDRHDPEPENVSRRDFLRGLGTGAVTTAALATGVPPPPAEAKTQEIPAAKGKRLKGTVRVTLNVNGDTKTADVEPRTTLLNTLRDHLDLTGAKKICDRGSCGGCTVIADGKAVYSCMMLAVDAQGKKLTTVEGLGTPERMSPVQEAFVEQDALMCGFCTPGFVVSCSVLLQKNPNPTLQQVKEACAGNVCRCGTYPRVFDAALAAAKKMRGGA
jgi:xanthine dehydrogenase YagT iron-sulfur-binding subunit